jgi:hypothetical protein
MLLRDHPPKSRHGVPNWLPVQAGIRELDNTRPNGEIGVLKSEIPPSIQSADGSFLCIDYEGSSYTGVCRLTFMLCASGHQSSSFNFAAIVP